VIARVLRVDVPPEQIDAVVEVYRRDVRPIHATAAGLRQHYVLVDRHTDRVGIIGIWESANAVSEVAPTLEPARQRLWDQFGSNPQLEIYDVADDLRS
jgi:heme-degrading monooxygenase HmoA